MVPGLRVVAEQRDVARGGADDRRDAVERPATLEEHERAGRHGHGGDELGRVAGQHAGDGVVALVDATPVGPPQPLHVLELATGVARLDRQRHDEVRLVEVPPERVALVHDGQVHGAERIGVAVERRSPEDAAHQLHQLVPLEERPQRRVRG